MATDFSNRPKPPVLKRFANLDIDGVERPPRPAPAASSARATPAPAPSRAPSRRDEPPVVRADADLSDLERLADDLNDNARAARASASDRTTRSRFNAPMPQTPGAQRRTERATELRGMRPPDPVAPPRQPSRRGPIVTSLGVDARPMPGWDPPRAAPLSREERDALEHMPPGVVTMEVDLRRRARPAAPPAPPLELTAMAARQVQLMSWEAGVPGSGLRILTSRVPGLGRPEIDFAFDDQPEPDDVVFVSHGVTIMIDPGSLRWVAGRRITWHDVPGSEGFRVG